MVETLSLIVWGIVVLLTAVHPGLGGLALLAGYGFSDRNFALIYAQIHRIPLFITEAVLGIALLRLTISFLPTIKRHVNRQLLRNPWFWFGTLGLWSLFRGLLVYEPLFVLRDSALAYYALFAALAYGMIKKVSHVWLIFAALGAGLFLRHLHRLIVYPLCDMPEGTAASAIYVAVLLFVLTCTHSQWGSYRRWVYVAMVLLGMSIFATAIRTAWISFALTFVMMLILVRRVPLQHGPSKRLGIVMVCSFVTLYSSYLILNPVRIDVLKSKFNSLSWGVDSPNVMTRIAMWEDSIEAVFPPARHVFGIFDKHVLYPWLGVSQPPTEDPKTYKPIKLNTPIKSAAAIIATNKAEPTAITQRSDASVVSTSSTTPTLEIIQETYQKESPGVSRRIERFNEHSAITFLFGIPFGKYFVPVRISYIHKADRYDPHNSIVAVFYRMGFLGLVAFFWILVGTLHKAYMAARNTPHVAHRELLLGAILGVIYHFFNSLGDVTLENPFKGGILWLLLGVLLALIRLDQSDAQKRLP